MRSILRFILENKSINYFNRLNSCQFCSKVKLKSNDSNVSESSYQKQGDEMPVSKGLPIIGTLFSLMWSGGGSNLHTYIDNRHKQFGPIFRETIGPIDGVFISDPQIMRKIYSLEGKYPVHILPEAWMIYNEMYGSKRGLYFMDGEEWLNYRRVLNKVFLTDYRSEDLEIVQSDAVEDWVNSWKMNINKEMKVDEIQFYKLSLSHILATLLGSSYLKYKNEFKESIDRLSDCGHKIFKESCKLNLIPAKLAVSLNLPPWKRFKMATDSAFQEGEFMVKQIVNICSDDGLMKKLIDENVSDKMLTKIIVDLILAAGDTTSYTTQWSIYLLSRNKDVQDELIKNPSDITLLKGIVKETLRLYPAAPFITRILPEDALLGGYQVKRGELLIMSLYSSGRDDKFFTTPENFWPDRWKREDVANCPTIKHSSVFKGVTDPNASQPFAMGIRSCVGRKLAESQLMTTLSKIASNFRLESLEETEMTLQFIPVPKTPIFIRLLPIKAS